MNKKGFISILLAAAVVLMAGTGVVLYRQRNSANILELAGKTENNQKVVSPNELPLAEQKEAVDSQTAKVWEKVIQEQKAAQKKTNQNQKNQVIQEQKKEPYIKVISPNGGEDLEAGTAYKIVWSSDGIEKNVQIDLRPKNTGSQIQIGYDVSNTGSYTWTVHESLSGEFKIIVRGMSDNKQFKDESDSYFRVVGTSISQWNTYRSLEYGVKFKYPEKARINGIGSTNQGYTLVTFPDSNQHVIKLAAITSSQNMVVAAALRGGAQKETEETVYIGNTILEKESGIGNTDEYDIYYEIYSTAKNEEYFAMVFAVLTDDKDFNPYSEFNTFDYMIHSLEFFEKQDLRSILQEGFVLGDANAPVTMIEYSSHSCSHCARFHQETLPLLIDKYVASGKVKIIQRFLSPVEFGMAVLCAQEQDKFWEMNEYLFKNVRNVELPEDIKAVAGEVGINEDNFNECFDSEKYEEEIMQWFESAEELGVNGTPTFFINGQRIDGNYPVSEFEKVIEEELAKVNF